MNAAWGYLIGAAVTGLSLLFNQWRSDRREQLRIEYERAQAEAQRHNSRAEERERWAREDARRWVLERRQGSVDLLSKLDPWVRNLRGWGNPWPYDTADEIEESRRRLRAFDWGEASDQVGNAWALLEILGSDQLREAYRSLLAQMYAVEAFTVGPINQDGLNGMVAAMNERYEKLLDAIRDDLGVLGPVESRLTPTTGLPPFVEAPSATSPDQLAPGS
ncbi:hypothetical protein OG618_18910 [Kitasatospora sp. NBC_01246]|uniref:hypothetical protein n=1 Tax=Kitasatospora sp. NBC_01246 TaxID=2903570 RepID=UPI002E37D31C|nr:hypothetical protein [Kitasatospora sp. NBC_01246]